MQLHAEVVEQIHEAAQQQYVEEHPRRWDAGTSARNDRSRVNREQDDDHPKPVVASRDIVFHGTALFATARPTHTTLLGIATAAAAAKASTATEQTAEQTHATTTFVRWVLVQTVAM